MPDIAPAEQCTTRAAAVRRAVLRLGSGSLVVGLLVAAHLIFGLARIPTGAIWKRWRSIEEYERLGPSWHFRLADEQTRRIARWVLEAVPREQVLLFDGSVPGQLQLLGPLRFPGLMVHVSALRPDGTAAGRPVFRGQPPWLEPSDAGLPVVVGTTETLRWERR